MIMIKKSSLQRVLPLFFSLAISILTRSVVAQDDATQHERDLGRFLRRTTTALSIGGFIMLYEARVAYQEALTKNPALAHDGFLKFFWRRCVKSTLNIGSGLYEHPIFTTAWLGTWGAIAGFGVAELAQQSPFQNRNKTHITYPPHVEKVLREMDYKDVTDRVRYDWLRNHIPWGTYADTTFNEKKFDEAFNGHYGLDNLKEALKEFFAARTFTGDKKGCRILFTGVTGAGKTTVAQALAKATGRELITISLGNASDAGSLAGDRKVFQGSTPGQIVQALRTSGCMNPIILLDEIDKCGTGGTHGDPYQALHSILDEAQNKNFTDNMLNVHMDISSIDFIATCNDPNRLVSSLRNRFNQTFEFKGYQRNEQKQIARKIIERIAQEYNLPDTFKNSLTDEVLGVIINNFVPQPGGARELTNAIKQLAIYWAGSLQLKQTPQIATVSVIELLKNRGFFVQAPPIP